MVFFILFVKHYKGDFSLQKCNKHNGVVDNKNPCKEDGLGLGCGSCLPRMPQALSLTQHKLSMLSHACHPQIQEAEVGGPEVQGCFLIQREFGASLAHLRLSQTNQKKTKIDIRVTGKHLESSRPHWRRERKSGSCRQPGGKVGLSELCLLLV